jgi:hypothetical protein
MAASAVLVACGNGDDNFVPPPKVPDASVDGTVPEGGEAADAGPAEAGDAEKAEAGPGADAAEAGPDASKADAGPDGEAADSGPDGD